jgi:ADP-ribosylation factor-like protein 5B
MGLVLSMWNSLFAGEQDVKVIIVGLNNSGKTTTLYQLHLGEVVSTQPTIGSNVEEIRRGKVRFQAWDLGGQESLRKTWSTYYTNTQAVILVVDSSERDRINVVKKELKLILVHEDLQKTVLLVCANKQDVKNAMTPAEISTALELHEIKGRPWHIQGCCALTGEGLNEGLDWVAQQLTR